MPRRYPTPDCRDRPLTLPAPLMLPAFREHKRAVRLRRVIARTRRGILAPHPTHPHVRAHGLVCERDQCTGLCVECGSENE